MAKKEEVNKYIECLKAYLKALGYPVNCEDQSKKERDNNAED